MANTLKFGNGEWYGKKDTILAYNDENSNYKPLPFDFSRASKATVINKDGLIEEVGSGQPRVDYKDDSKGAFLLEPSRSNLIPYSEDFSNSGWTKNNTTITSGFTSPDGTNNAYLMTDDATDNKHGVYDIDVLSQDGNVYTRSVFVKKGTARYVVLSARHLPTSSGTSWIYDFDINNWVLIGSTGVGQSIEDYGNGWIRLSISHISNSNFNNDFSIGISSGATISDATYSGSGDTLYIYGAQAEQGSYATSYIPTQGSAVTRLADSCSQTVPDGVIGQTEGTMYAEYYFDATIDNSGGSDRDVVSISANSSNIIKIVHFGNGTASYNKKVYFVAIVGGSYVVTIISGQYSSGLMKVAAAYKNNDYVLYVNGVQIGTDSNAGVPACSVFTLGKFTSAIPTPTPINETKLYNTRLSNSELQALTQV